MKKTLLFVLTLAGLCALSTSIFRDYRYIPILKTWAEAQSYCREMFNDLATVEDQDNNEWLLSVSEGKGERAWIGLYDDPTRWKWTLGNADFNTDTDFSNWNSPEPDNVGSKENCSVITTDGKWRDIDCLDLRPAVCYSEQGPSKYILVTTTMTWYQAKSYCRSKYTDLAIVRDSSENNQFASLLSTRSWTGLHRKLWANWSDQTPTAFTNWDVGQPDNFGTTMQSCVMININTGMWLDFDCETKHHFICQNIAPRRKTFKLKVQSEADLNDPAVKQQILEQLHTKLENHGVADFKLRWIEKDGQTFHKEQKKKKEEGCS